MGPSIWPILENGQYDKNWKYIHTLPEQFFTVAADIRAKRVLPVHFSKFALANHAWDEPLIKLMENNKDPKISILTPMIGEPVYLNQTHQQFSAWWKGVK